MIFANILSAFVLGLLTPLTAVCVLPLYPGFLAYLAGQLNKATKENKKLLALFGLIIVAGVISFMLLLGLVFTTLLQVSLTSVIGIVSPIAFGLLLLISLLLIFDVDFGKIFPKVHAPIVGNPLFSAFIFGFFFGAIVVPCNPAFIAALFARALLEVNFATNILSFVSFGLGLGAPLLLFSLISLKKSTEIIGFLTKHKTVINRTAGVFMLVVSIYYIVYVFKVFG